MTKVVKVSEPFSFEYWVPWIITGLILLIVFPYSKIKDYFTPEPIKIIEYVEVPVPQYIYIEKPEVETAEPIEPVVPKEPIVCVFDIDNTITDGVPGRCIKMCKDMGCKLAINTTRDIDNPNDLDLVGLGLTAPHFEESDYYFNPNAKTSSFDDAAATKSAHMATIQNKYGISDRKRLILFDDNKMNIEKVEADGFTGIRVAVKDPGIQEPDIVKAHAIIKSLI